MDLGTAKDFIEDLVQQVAEIESGVHNLQEQLRIAREARARWEATANILAGEIKNIMGTADMYKRYESHALHWAWERSRGQD